MRSVTFKDKTRDLGAPCEWDQSDVPCNALAIRDVHMGDHVPGMESYWKPSKEELVMLNNGGFVKLTIVGTTHPPVSVEVEAELAI